METSTESLRDILRNNRRVAVLGAHRDPKRPAHYIPKGLSRAGYSVYPVNPALAGEELFGQTVAASLQDLREPIDIVNVFRRSEDLPDHLDEILALEPKPSVVWLQSGIRHAEVQRALEAAGITVVADRCILSDHQRLL